MGKLEGQEDSIPYQELSRSQASYKRLAIQQFLFILGKNPNTVQYNPRGRVIRWGWEIEGHMLRPDASNRLALHADFPVKEAFNNHGIDVMREYGSWMFEIVASQPYSTLNDLLQVFRELKRTYDTLYSTGYTYLTIPHIPLLGAEDSTSKPNRITKSQYVHDELITEHPRYYAMMTNMIQRRNGLPHTYLPLYQDKNTLTEHQQEPQPGKIHLDSILFGFGTGCLQTTFQAHSLHQARHLHDQLNIMSPIFLALTASTPFVKSKISNLDARYSMISSTCDDRTTYQKNPQHLDYFPTSRHGTCNFYIGTHPANLPEYSDFDTHIRKEATTLVREEVELRKAQLDQSLLNYLSILVSRDITYLFRTTPLTQTNPTLYEFLLATHWGSVKLKLPTSDINWRVELRTMETQLRADENAAFSLLSYLLTRLINERQDLNFYLPISCYRQNMHRAHLNNAVISQKFLFRTNVHSSGPAVVEELSCYEIFFGKDKFVGVFGLIEQQLSREKDSVYSQTIFCLKQFLKSLLTGEKLTMAQWMRRFVARHPLYKQDSVLSVEVMDDLLRTLDGIQRGTIRDPNFVPIFEGVDSSKQGSSVTSETDSTDSISEKDEKDSSLTGAR